MGKKKDKLELTNDERKKCMAIIHGAATAAGATGTGLAQIPLADNAIITPIQITMIISLGAVFGKKITESVAKAILASAGANVVGRGISQVMFGWIPVLGNVINTATAAGLTEAIGWMAVDHFLKVKKEEENDAADEVEKNSENVQSEMKEKREELMKRADCFINREKTLEQNEDEYYQLQNELEKVLLASESKDKEVCEKLHELSELEWK